MSVKSEERREKLRLDLIESAERHIADHGLAGLKARTLARDVGCALGAIYNVFPDMDALTIAVNSRTLARLDREIAKFTNVVDQQDAPEETMVGLALAYLQFASDHTNLWSALFDFGMQSNKPTPDWHLDEHLRLIGYIVDVLNKISPSISEDRVWTLARALFSAVHGIVQLGLEERYLAVPRAELQQQIRLIVRAVTHGIRQEFGE